MAMMQPPPMALARIAVASLAYHGISLRSILDYRPSSADVALEGIAVSPLITIAEVSFSRCRATEVHADPIAIKLIVVQVVIVIGNSIRAKTFSRMIATG
jgi:hypothetical protein